MLLFIFAGVNDWNTQPSCKTGFEINSWPVTGIICYKKFTVLNHGQYLIADITVVFLRERTGPACTCEVLHTGFELDMVRDGSGEAGGRRLAVLCLCMRLGG